MSVSCFVGGLLFLDEGFIYIVTADMAVWQRKQDFRTMETLHVNDSVTDFQQNDGYFRPSIFLYISPREPAGSVEITTIRPLIKAYTILYPPSRIR